MSSLLERIDRFEHDLERMEGELRSLRSAVVIGEAVTVPVVPRPAPVEPVPVAPPPPITRPMPAAIPAVPPRPRRQLDVAALVARLDLFGAGGLAVVGGAVTALGITLLFVLAAEQGWIGPVARIAAGAVVSTLFFAAGLVVRRRYGQLVAGLAAVAAGIAGAYATLAAAAALYDLVSDPLALVLAAGIAGLAAAVSLAWNAELVAALGLTGAALAPALQGLETGIAPDGLAFAVVVLAATAVVSVVRRWERLLGALAAVVGGQALWLVELEGRTSGAATLAVTAAFAGVVLVAGCAWQLRLGARELQRLTTPLVLLDLGFVLLGSYLLLEPGRERGVALAVAAAPFVLGWLALRRLQPDLAVVLVAGFLGLAAVAVAEILAGDGLSISWAAQAAVLAVLAHRLRDMRLQLAGLAYLALATGHFLVVGEPFDGLFDLAGVDAQRALPAVALAIAAALAAVLAPRAYRATGERGVLAFLEPLAVTLLERRAVLVEVLGALATALGLLGLGLGAVAVDLHAGHLVLTGVGAAVATAGMLVAARRESELLAALAFVFSLAVAGKAVVFDLIELGDGMGGTAALLAAGGMLAAGVLLRVCWRTSEPLGVASGVAAVLALGVAYAGLTELAPQSETPERLWFGVKSSLLAAVYLGLAALTHRRPRLRNLSTTLWAIGLAPLLVAELAFTDENETLLAVAVAATAASLALVGRVARDGRLWVAAVGLLGLDVAAILAEVASLEQLLVADTHPAAGLLALLAAIAATCVLALTGSHARRLGIAAAVLGLYAVSLAALDVTMRVSGAGLETDFERGHTAVSVVWALTGLGLLLAGVVRRTSLVRYAGLALFGLTLGKIFLYDLAELSSVARAVSFVAVGGLLLVGGFFVQRLGEREATTA